MAEIASIMFEFSQNSKKLYWFLLSHFLFLFYFFPLQVLIDRIFSTQNADFFRGDNSEGMGARNEVNVFLRDFNVDFLEIK